MRGDPEHAVLRRIEPIDIPACIDVFYESVDPLYARLDQSIPPRDPGSLGRLIGHMLDHDAGRAWLAESPSATGDPDPPRVLGFGTAWQRESTWYLALLFIRPEAQAGGLGRRLLLRTFPGGPLEPPPVETPAQPQAEPKAELPAQPQAEPRAEVPAEPSSGPRAGLMATCVDSIQPISTGLYASYGIVPRVPLFTAIGYPRPNSLPKLPRGVVATAFDAAEDDARLAETVAAVDREVLGFARPVDHRLWAREGRRGVLFRRSGGGEALGYGYAQASGRIGPVALLDDTLYPGVLGTLVGRVSPPGAYLVLVPGLNHRAMVALLRAGFRFEGFPGILSSTRPWDGIDRYLPASFALP